MIPAELQADVSQNLLHISPCFPQATQVIDRELEHSAHPKRHKTHAINRCVDRTGNKHMCTEQPSEQVTGMAGFDFEHQFCFILVTNNLI